MTNWTVTNQTAVTIGKKEGETSQSAKVRGLGSPSWRGSRMRPAGSLDASGGILVDLTLATFDLEREPGALGTTEPSLVLSVCVDLALAVNVSVLPERWKQEGTLIQRVTNCLRKMRRSHDGRINPRRYEHLSWSGR